MPKITAERLGRLLHRQQGFAPPHHPDVVGAARAAVGLPGVNPWSYLAMLPRVARFTVPLLEDALVEDKAVVRVTCMRGQVNIVPKDLVATVYAATRGLVLNRLRAELDHAKIPREEYEQFKHQAMQILGVGPATATEIARNTGRVAQEAEAATTMMSGMSAEGLVVRTEAKGGWQSNVNTYARWMDWLPDVKLQDVDSVAARRKLADYFVRGYGPAKLDDFQKWSGLPEVGAKEAWDAMDIPVFEVEGVGEVKGTARQKMNLGSVEPPYTPMPAFLPPNDPYVLAYSDPARIMPASMAPHVFDAEGNATSTVVFDGQVIGLWGYEASRRRVSVKVAPFENAPATLGKMLEAPIGRLADFLGVRELAIERYEVPPALDTQGPLAYLSPLKNERPVA